MAVYSYGYPSSFPESYVAMNYPTLNFSGDGYNAEKYFDLVNKLGSETNINVLGIQALKSYQRALNQLDLENKYSGPVPYIGLYIAAASLICIVLMGFDLIHGIRSSKPWFPCKFFSINAASLTVIAIAMKLPVDLSGCMPGVGDQMAKLGSVAFMCTMMANLLPSLATMDSNALLANVTALGVLVITMVVNLLIQIITGVVESYKTDPSEPFRENDDLYSAIIVPYSGFAIIYVIMLLMLLIIHVCSCLAILKSKQIIESKYQQKHETAPKDVQQSTEKFVSLEKHVRKYWIMAGSGSPQFIIACSATTTASGVVCALTTILHTLTIAIVLTSTESNKYDSDYKWSMLVIYIVQIIGVILGAIAPVCRCFASSSFKVSGPSILKHLNVFKVESYWTQKLSDWKHDSKKFPFYCRKRNIVLKIMKILILEFSIKLQQVVVVICKIIALIMYFVMICLVCFFGCLKWLLQVVCSSGKGTENLEDNYKYVLHLDEKIELAESILKRLLKSLDKVIKKGKKNQPSNLIKLIKEKSTIGFQGVIRSDLDDHGDCWTLAVINLTTIAVTLRKNKKVDSLLKSVRESLEYVTLVEENLDATDVSIQKATKKLWEEVDFRHKWLGIKLNERNFKVDAANGKENDTMQIVNHFQKLASGAGSTDGVGQNSDSKCTSSCLNSMSCITGAITRKAERNTDDEGPNDFDSKFKNICMKSMSRITTAIIDDHKESNKESFDELISSRIADTIAACLTYLPKVIEMKCHTDVIEKREKSVKAAAKLLGKTEEIIKFLEDPCRQVPSTNHDDVLT